MKKEREIEQIEYKRVGGDFLFSLKEFVFNVALLNDSQLSAYTRCLGSMAVKGYIQSSKYESYVSNLSANERDELTKLLEVVEDGYVIPWVEDALYDRQEYNRSRSKNRTKNM